MQFNMKFFPLLVVFQLFVLIGSAQTNDKVNGEPLGDTILPTPKINLQDFFATHIRYPDISYEAGVDGTARIKARVTTEGNLDSISISEGVKETGMSPDPGKELNDEALRVVKLIPP